ncbi:hypothetical protein CEXT_270071, partial [Caerostris extrusa]
SEKTRGTNQWSEDSKNVMWKKNPLCNRKPYHQINTENPHHGTCHPLKSEIKRITQKSLWHLIS